MYGVEREPMMLPYSSFSISTTAMCAGAPPLSLAGGDCVRWTGPRRTALAPQPAISAATSRIVVSTGGLRQKGVAKVVEPRASPAGGEFVQSHRPSVHSCACGLSPMETGSNLLVGVPARSPSGQPCLARPPAGTPHIPSQSRAATIKRFAAGTPGGPRAGRGSRGDRSGDRVLTSSGGCTPDAGLRPRRPAPSRSTAPAPRRSWPAEPRARRPTRSCRTWPRAYSAEAQGEKPVPDLRVDRRQVGSQAVIASDLDHGAPVAGRRHAELVALALDHEHRYGHRVELGQAARGRLGGRPPRWLEREGQAQHR